MDNFTVIYKILKALEQAMDYDEFDVKQISHTRLNISFQRWEKILIMLAKSGYIEGVIYDQCSGDYCPHIEEPIAPVITLKGLEYLNDNSIMKKNVKCAKRNQRNNSGIVENRGGTAMEKKVYIGLLDTRQKKQEAVVHLMETYADDTITDRYSGLVDRLTTSLYIRECTDVSERFRIDKALWDTGASSSCISERLARKMGLRPVDTGVGISTIGQQDITYYIVDVCLTPEMIFRNIKIAGFPLENHDVDFIIGMDIISKGNLSVTNKNGNTEVRFTV